MTEEEKREMTRSNFAAQMAMLGYEPGGNQKDLVEIVRCKDCKHRPELKLYSDKRGNYTAVEFPDGSKCPCHCEDFFYSWYPQDDWFCANGERKTEDA